MSRFRIVLGMNHDHFPMLLNLKYTNFMLQFYILHIISNFCNIYRLHKIYNKFAKF